jgi:Beta-lactamase
VPDPGPAPLDDAARLVAARSRRTQLCVIWHGRVVLDRAFGCPPDSLFFLFSASKPLVALLVHQLAERGALGLDDPVAARWAPGTWRPSATRSSPPAADVRHQLPGSSAPYQDWMMWCAMDTGGGSRSCPLPIAAARSSRLYQFASAISASSTRIC